MDQKLATKIPSNGQPHWLLQWKHHEQLRRSRASYVAVIKKLTKPLRTTPMYPTVAHCHWSDVPHSEHELWLITVSGLESEKNTVTPYSTPASWLAFSQGFIHKRANAFHVKQHKIFGIVTDETSLHRAITWSQMSTRVSQVGKN